MPLKSWYKLVTPREDLREGRPLRMLMSFSTLNSWGRSLSRMLAQRANVKRS